MGFGEVRCVLRRVEGGWYGGVVVAMCGGGVGWAGWTERGWLVVGGPVRSVFGRCLRADGRDVFLKFYSVRGWSGWTGR